MIQAFKANARAGVPITAIETPDQQQTVTSIMALMGQDKRPFLRWDICGGLVGLNQKGKTAAGQAGIEAGLTQNPVEALGLTVKLPPQSVIFMLNVHLHLDQPTLIQAIANMRDLYKQDQRMLVLLGPSFQFGPELVRDVIIIDEPLPGQDGIESVVKQQFINAALPAPTAETVAEASKILLGCSMFEAEQLAATSLTKNGLDFEQLWAKKKLLIGQTPGMSLWSGGQTFDQIGGLQNWKARLTRVINGRADIGLILFFDEVEKMFGGASTDSSGVSQDFHGQWLTWAQDNEILGAILVGASGGGKSLSSKAAGSVKRSGRIPVLSCDVGAMKSSLVGSSEARFRNFLKVAKALVAPTQRILVICTCNDLRGLSPEFKARMTLGTFFFDFPNEEERAAIWPIYLERFGLGTYADLPDELKQAPWTGREIKAACETAWNEDLSLLEAARNIVPVSQTDNERMNALRTLADGTFLSASYEGVYQRERAAREAAGMSVGTDRTISTGDAWDQV